MNSFLHALELKVNSLWSSQAMNGIDWLHGITLQECTNFVFRTYRPFSLVESSVVCKSVKSGSSLDSWRPF